MDNLETEVLLSKDSRYLFIKIAKFLNENEYDNGNIDIVMYIETQERLNLLNIEYFKLNNKNEKYQKVSKIFEKI